MANQYTDNFIKILERKTKKPAKEALLNFQHQSCTYIELAKYVGFKHGVARKWCRRYNIELVHPIIKDKINAPSYLDVIRSSLKLKHIDSQNFLYKPWII